MTLPTTTRARLRLYRERAADPKRINKDWRAHRYARTWEPTAYTWSEDRRKIYADTLDLLAYAFATELGGQSREFDKVRFMLDCGCPA